jgi:hypothetical protein
VSTKTYAQLLEENVALRLLLEEAHDFGTHSWACALTLRTADGCDCWFERTTEALMEPFPLLVSLEDIECTCGHPADDHTGRITGQPQAVCVICACPCMAFAPRPDPMGKSPTKS